LAGVIFARTRWIAEDTLAEHDELHPFFLGVVKDSVSDGARETPGPQRLQFSGDMPEDRGKLEADVGGRRRGGAGVGGGNR
jgi:hypothetical protein